MNSRRIKFVVSLFCIECLIIILFVLFVSYEDDITPIFQNSSVLTKISKNEENSTYQDLQLMIFLGLAFLHVTLKNYGYSSLGSTMILSVIGIQWAVLCRGIFHHDKNGTIRLGITSLINADFATAAVLISVGAVLGIASPLQMVVICLVEICFFVLNEYIAFELLQISDIGGSIYIHAFAAYFGLSLSLILRAQKCASVTVAEKPSKSSELISMIGTLILWVYWPSFNGILANGADSKQRAVINTLLSLCGSTLFTFVVSVLVSEESKMTLTHLSNATLAGGAAIGCVADLMIKPFGAILIGSLGGTISTLGYAYLTPFLETKIHLHDSCGIHNLHGLMGILGGISGAVMAAFSSEIEHGESIYRQYPARAPSNKATFQDNDNEYELGLGRSAETQALYQLAALGVTLLIAITSGSLTGLMLRIPIFGHTHKKGYFQDSYFFTLPKDNQLKKRLIVNESPSASPKPLQSNEDLEIMSPIIAKIEVIENNLEMIEEEVSYSEDATGNLNV